MANTQSPARAKRKTEIDAPKSAIAAEIESRRAAFDEGMPVDRIAQLLSDAGFVVSVRNPVSGEIEKLTSADDDLAAITPAEKLSLVVASIDPDTDVVTLLVTGRSVPLSPTLHQSAFPIGIAPTGAVGENGALTLGTALPATYNDGIFLHFPAGAVQADSPAGFYFCTMTSGTEGTVFGDIYTPGTAAPTLPAAPAAIVDPGPGAYVGETAAVAAVSITLPGGLLGPNGRARFDLLGAHTDSAGDKTYSVHFGGEAIVAATGSTSQSLSIPGFLLANRGRADRQVAAGDPAGGTSAVAPLETAIDTAADVVIEIKLQRAAATDSMVLDRAGIVVELG